MKNVSIVLKKKNPKAMNGYHFLQFLKWISAIKSQVKSDDRSYSLEHF